MEARVHLSVHLFRHWLKRYKSANADWFQGSEGLTGYQIAGQPPDNSPIFCPPLWEGPHIAQYSVQ